MRIELKEVVQGVTAPPACDQTLCIEVVSAEDGVAKCLWMIDERFLNGHEMVMGGYITSAMDISMAYSMASILEEKQGFATINLQTNFFRPLFTGTAQVESVILKRGRKTCYLEATVMQNGQCVAKMNSSLMVLE